MKMIFGAIGICVKDIANMVEFYRDVIGLDIEWDGGPFAGVKMSNGVFSTFTKGNKALKLSQQIQHFN